MKKFLIIIGMVFILWVVWLYNPFIFKGYIYHARYGIYPEIVPFKSKMSIMPLQTAILGQPTSIKKNEDGTTTVTWE